MQLSDDQQKAIEHARRAMAQGLEISVGPKLALPLAVIAISGAFADVVSASASRSGSALVDVINSQLEACGLRLVALVAVDA